MAFCFALHLFVCFVCECVCTCRDMCVRVRTTCESLFFPTVQVGEMEIRPPGWCQSIFNLFIRLSYLHSQPFVFKPPPMLCFPIYQQKVLPLFPTVTAGGEPPCPLAAFHSIKVWQDCCHPIRGVGADVFTPACMTTRCCGPQEARSTASQETTVLSVTEFLQ